MLASQEVFSLCWRLELSELLRDEGEDALSAAWMVQERQNDHLFLSGPLVPMEFFGGNPVESEFAVSLLLWCRQYLLLFSKL